MKRDFASGSASIAAVLVHLPLVRRDRLGAAALRAALLAPVPLVGHEGLVDGKVLDVGLQDVDHVGLAGHHHQLNTSTQSALFTSNKSEGSVFQVVGRDPRGRVSRGYMGCLSFKIYEFIEKLLSFYFCKYFVLHHR